jgi:hypothetical protein
MMNKNYKAGAATAEPAKAAPAKKVAPKTIKIITCVKGKVTKKVSTAACPSGYKKK